MEKLDVYPTTERIKTDARFLFWFAVIVFGGIGALILYGDTSFDSSNPLEDIIAAIAGLWFSFYFANEVIRLDRLSKHQGPLLTFSPEGVTDHLFFKRELKWEDINFVGCRSSSEGRTTTVNHFTLQPTYRPWQYWLRRLYSTPMKYHTHRLNIPTADKARSTSAYTYKHINKYIRDHAPKAYRKKSRPRWWTYLSWLLMAAAFIWVWWELFSS